MWQLGHSDLIVFFTSNITITVFDVPMCLLESRGHVDSSYASFSYKTLSNAKPFRFFY